MGIFSRLGTLIKSNINDLITRAEDPEKMLQQVLLEMNQQLVDAKKRVAVAIADEKKLQKQYNAELDKSKEWERKAMVAVRAGNDELARQALVRKQEHDGIASQYQQQWIAQKQAVDKLKDALRLLNNKIEEAKRKKNILIARKKRAEAHQQIATTMQGLGDTTAFDTFDRMAERIDMLEAEAEASSELAGELSGDNLEAQFPAARVRRPWHRRRGPRRAQGQDGSAQAGRGSRDQAARGSIGFIAQRRRPQRAGRSRPVVVRSGRRRRHGREGRQSAISCRQLRAGYRRATSDPAIVRRVIRQLSH